MTHLLLVSHYSVIGTAGAGGLLFMAIENEPVDAGERGELRLGYGVETRRVSDTRLTHYPPSISINSDERSNLSSVDCPPFSICSNGGSSAWRSNTSACRATGRCSTTAYSMSLPVVLLSSSSRRRTNPYPSRRFHTSEDKGALLTLLG
jgi:hypothetical protein